MKRTPLKKRGKVGRAICYNTLMTKAEKVKRGEKFNNLTFIKLLEKRRLYDGDSRRWVALFKCDCGKEVEKDARVVINGLVKSCGCLHKKASLRNLEKIDSSTHGMSKTKPYKVWTSMKQRCDNKKAVGYENYGGRGISYCDRWEDFENFWEDMGGGYKEGLTLGRIDNNGNYNPENCRWESNKEQAKNRTNTVSYIVGGKKFKYLDEAAKHFDVAKSTIKYWCKTKKDCYKEKKYA